MNLAFPLLLASSLLCVNTSTIPIVTTNEYRYENKIDLITIEPTKHSSYTSLISVMVSFSNPVVKSTTLEIKVSNSRYPSGKSIALFYPSRQAYTYTYEYDQRYSNVSREDTFTFILTGKGNDTVEITSRVYEPQSMYIRNENETFQTPFNIAVYRSIEGKWYQAERFTFKNMQQEIYLDKVPALDMSGIYFNYEMPKYIPLRYGYARLIIEGCAGVFLDVGEAMATEGNRKCALAIDKDEKKGNFRIHLTDQLYVNPMSLEMSTSPKEGYKQTNYLYFPRPVEEEETYVLRYMVDEFGANSSNFSYQFSVTISKNAFGSCSDSSFCLSSEDTTPDLSIGTIINH